MAVSHVYSNTAADFTGTITGFNSQGSTVTIAATNLVRPSDWNSAHNQYFTLSGNTNNSSVVSGTNVVLSGDNNITLIGSGATIGISAPTANEVILSSVANLPGWIFNTQTIKPTQSTFYVFPVQVTEPVEMDRIRFASSISIASTSFASTANTTFTFGQFETLQWVLYKRGTGGNSQSLSYISSDQEFISWTVQAAYGSASNTRQSHDFGFTYYDSAGNTSSFSTGYSTSNTSVMVISTGNLTRLTGIKQADVPFVTTLSPGDYWMAIRHSTTSSTQATNMSGVRIQANFLAASQLNNAIGALGEVNNASKQILPALGSFTTVGGATTSSLAFSNVSSSASHPIPLVTFGRGLP